MSKVIIDIHQTNYFGDDYMSSEEAVDEYDLVGREVADFLRREMKGTLKRYIIVEVEE